jgi:hypothetical protein
MKKRLCKCGCGQEVKGHPNKRFFNKKHKDKYWNTVNPRGFGLHSVFAESTRDRFSIEPEDIEDSMHPLDPYSLGQWDD